MKRVFLSAVALVLSFSAMAANAPKWEDPNVFDDSGNRASGNRLQ